MSAIRWPNSASTPVIASAPTASGMSETLMACRKTRPMPGHEKIVSVTIPPPLTNARARTSEGGAAPADDEREGENQRGRHGEHGIASRVPVSDDPVRNALRACGEDVVLAQ